MNQTLDTEALKNLPIFPLPKLVFLPHTLLPLHIFEPRYREMIDHCLANSTPLGITMIAPGHENEQPGDPPLVEVFGVGHIAAWNRLPDGRYVIAVSGAARGRILAERTAGTSFRTARVELLDESGLDDPALADKVRTARGCLASLMSIAPQAGKAIGPLLDEALSAAELADRVVDTLVNEALERQAFLETLDVPSRLDAVLGHLINLLPHASPGAFAN